MIMKKIIGQVTHEETETIRTMFEIRIALENLNMDLDLKS